MKAYLRIKKNSPYYYCLLKWQEGDKTKSKEVSTGIPTKGNNKRKAELARDKLREEYETKYEKNRVSVCDILFTEYYEEWLEQQKRVKKPTTYYGYEKIYFNHIKPYFEQFKLKLIDITPKHIQDYYNFKIDDGLSVNTVKKHHANIRKSLQDALKLNMVPFNMADRTTLPKIKKYIPKVYDAKQLSTLLQIVKDSVMESVVVICIYYGLRRGEVCGLRWSDVDLKNRVLYVSNSRVLTSEEIFQESTKTQDEPKEFPINDEMYKYFIKLKAKQTKDRFALGRAYKDTDFVCVWEDGEPLKVSYVSHKFDEILRKNNLPHIRLHDLRHSCATNMLKNGVDIKIIQEYLGHSTITTTANFYLHPDIGQKMNAINVLSDALKEKRA